MVPGQGTVASGVFLALQPLGTAQHGCDTLCSPCLSNVEGSIAQQPLVSTVWLPGGGGSPDAEILLKGLFSCVRLCAFIAKVHHYWVKNAQ